MWIVGCAVDRKKSRVCVLLNTQDSKIHQWSWVSLTLMTTWTEKKALIKPHCLKRRSSVCKEGSNNVYTLLAHTQWLLQTPSQNESLGLALPCFPELSWKESSYSTGRRVIAMRLAWLWGNKMCSVSTQIWPRWSTSLTCLEFRIIIENN